MTRSPPLQAIIGWLFALGSGTNTQIVGRISPWIDVDSSDAFDRRNSELALLQELNWAAHLALPAMIVPLRRPHNPNLARLLMQFLKGARFPYVIWIQIPMKIPQVEQVVSPNFA